MPNALFSYEYLIHLVAGGTAGTIGATVTCPLEVIKTRLQSSARDKLNVNVPLYKCFGTIVRREGWRALFKGLGPNLIGVAPSRALYFATYSTVKDALNKSSIDNPESSLIHMTSAASAGFVTCTATNPIWLVKTRLQLRKDSMTALQCLKHVWTTSGVRGFYKGIFASYCGISETIIHFQLYEYFKYHIKQRRLNELKSEDKFDSNLFLMYMCSGAVSKGFACFIAYPHEVARTRLREEGTIYKKFWQTISLTYKQEGVVGLYRGFPIHLIRTIPLTAITMSMYELIVSIFHGEIF